ncbi:hypothetical protein Q7O_001392 [Pectobacterium carotovorum subsp. carotovorum PCCS1]|nr:hypothetical protein KKH3_25350 [Pectobacterium actinidiae]MBG0751946.1 hypothetical protein [Pectobacterium carotovorum subsp. carotovorum PCCS1]
MTKQNSLIAQSIKHFAYIYRHVIIFRKRKIDGSIRWHFSR